VDVPGFLVAQFAGGAVATAIFRWLIPGLRERAKDIVMPHEGVQI